ncbi:elongation factor P [Spirochaetia bacterium]|nr:elongation factor P [Spirochaetia bacterium]
MYIIEGTFENTSEEFMIRGGDIVKGSCLLQKGQPFLVVDREFHTPGKGTAIARVKMKSIKDGSVLTMTIPTQQEVEDATVDTHTCQFQYADQDNFHFMDNEHFDQFEVPISSMEDKKNYLQEGGVYDLTVWDGNVIDIKIPYKVVFTVAESENYVKGDTVSGATKPVTTETGLTVRVPLFIKQGEKILVNTETNEYVERVNS